MLGLAFSIALLISSVIAGHNGGDSIIVAAQLVAAAIFYVGFWAAYIGTKLNDIYKTTALKELGVAIKELEDTIEEAV